MNEELAGATLLAFGSSLPDLVANLMPIRAESAYFDGTIGDAVVIVLLCGGLICYMKPFKMDEYVIVRELLFLLLSVELLRFLIFDGDSISHTDGIILLSVYLIYLIIIIADLKLLRFTIRQLRRQIANLERQPISTERDRKLRKKISNLKNLIQHEFMHIRRKSLRGTGESSSNIQMIGAPFAHSKPEPVDYEATRTILHSKKNAKNLFLWGDFLDSLNPIDATDWKLAGPFQRVFIVIRSPMLLIVTIFVPVVDYERYKHGWSKLLNCTQIITNPFILITAIHSKFVSVYSSWYVDFNINYAKWSLLLSVPLALFTFFHARTDMPPPYHILFIVLSSTSSLVIIVFCTGEIEVLISIVGIVFNLSEHFLSITFGSVGNAVINLMASFAMTMQGYERMAFTAVFAGPFFNIVVSMGITFLFNENVRLKGASTWLNGEHGDNCYIFILITIVSTLWWCLTFNFIARRSSAIFYWILFVLFIVYAIAVEWDLVHDMTKDVMFPPK
ncbi:mitochondrial sodium/calcium exchanger protein-like [Drosophila innubila]|uniref:mitochondrial sodium/calcium exchanger protein-like n=1 Tax=Drosophila innubila TaxID=198719 RepID=UPI00148E2651|nr:mitochondrial sodium/calcium exchanger protein-like [Drosophila innubila]